MSVWKPSVTVAAVIERDGKFLFVEELIDGRKSFITNAGGQAPRHAHALTPVRP